MFSQSKREIERLNALLTEKVQDEKILMQDIERRKARYLEIETELESIKNELAEKSKRTEELESGIVELKSSMLLLASFSKNNNVATEVLAKHGIDIEELTNLNEVKINLKVKSVPSRRKETSDLEYVIANLSRNIKIKLSRYFLTPIIKLSSEEDYRVITITSSIIKSFDDCYSAIYNLVADSEGMGAVEVEEIDPYKNTVDFKVEVMTPIYNQRY